MDADDKRMVPWTRYGEEVVAKCHHGGYFIIKNVKSNHVESAHRINDYETCDGGSSRCWINHIYPPDTDALMRDPELYPRFVETVKEALKKRKLILDGLDENEDISKQKKAFQKRNDRVLISRAIDFQQLHSRHMAHMHMVNAIRDHKNGGIPELKICNLRFFVDLMHKHWFTVVSMFDMIERGVIESNGSSDEIDPIDSPFVKNAIQMYQDVIDGGIEGQNVLTMCDDIIEMIKGDKSREAVLIRHTLNDLKRHEGRMFLSSMEKLKGVLTIEQNNKLISMSKKGRENKIE